VNTPSASNRSPAARILPLLTYLAMAMVMVWPAVGEWGELIPGSARSDLWNGLWTSWMTAEAVFSGESPLHTNFLGFPDGGTLVPADLPGALVIGLLGKTFGLPAAYTGFVIFRLAIGGFIVHRFAADLWSSERRAWVAGCLFTVAPVLLSGVHNGTTEAFAGGAPAFTAWMFWKLYKNGRSLHGLLAALGLGFCALISPYAASVALLFGGGWAVQRLWECQFSGKRTFTRAEIQGWGIFISVSLCTVAPWGWLVHQLSTDPGNLIGIKDLSELDRVRRGTGPADPRIYLWPGEFFSPDFPKISRYGEEFIHCSYLGIVALTGAVGSLRRPSGPILAMIGSCGALLSLGPVLLFDGLPYLFADERVMPMPYLLVEDLPGFSSLSLLWRLGLAPTLAVALLAAGVPLQERWLPIFLIAATAELAFFSPTAQRGLTTPVPQSPALLALAKAPPGAVVNFPLVGGRPYLYEQTIHQKPLAASLNFPNNHTGRKVWRILLDEAPAPAADRLLRIRKRARKLGVRYVVLHTDPLAEPDMHDGAVRALLEVSPPLPAGDAADIQVVPLW
jgi:hypothetical protein